MDNKKIFINLPKTYEGLPYFGLMLTIEGRFTKQELIDFYENFHKLYRKDNRKIFIEAQGMRDDHYWYSPKLVRFVFASDGSIKEKLLRSYYGKEPSYYRFFHIIIDSDESNLCYLIPDMMFRFRSLMKTIQPDCNIKTNITNAWERNITRLYRSTGRNSNIGDISIGEDVITVELGYYAKHCFSDRYNDTVIKERLEFCKHIFEVVTNMNYGPELFLCHTWYGYKTKIDSQFFKNRLENSLLYDRLEIVDVFGYGCNEEEKETETFELIKKMFGDVIRYLTPHYYYY